MPGDLAVTNTGRCLTQETISFTYCDCVMDGCSSYQKGVCGDPDLGAPNNQCGGPGGNGGPGHSSGDNAGGPDDAYPNCEPRGNVLIVDENGSNVK
jgi:hypothetical protein